MNSNVVRYFFQFPVIRVWPCGPVGHPQAAATVKEEEEEEFASLYGPILLKALNEPR